MPGQKLNSPSPLGSQGPDMTHHAPITLSVYISKLSEQDDLGD